MIASRPDLEKLVASNLIVRGDGEPIAVDHVSIGLHLDRELVTYAASDSKVIPPATLPTTSRFLGVDERSDFGPGMKLLACSVEYIRMPLDHMGFIQTKGSLARGFVLAHMCDGQIDPGFNGKVTFELINLSDLSYQLVYGMPIAQLFIFRLTTPLPSGYDGRYQGADRPTAMKDPAPRK